MRIILKPWKTLTLGSHMESRLVLPAIPCAGIIILASLAKTQQQKKMRHHEEICVQDPAGKRAEQNLNAGLANVPADRDGSPGCYRHSALTKGRRWSHGDRGVACTNTFTITVWLHILRQNRTKIPYFSIQGKESTFWQNIICYWNMEY